MATRRNALIAATVCFCALLLAGSAVDAVVEKPSPTRRPFKVYGDAEVVIDWSSPWYTEDGRLYVPWTMTASRVCTEGWFEDAGEGRLYLDTGVLEGSGLCRENDGDILEWESTQEWGTQHVDVKITAGHGQFAGVTGSYSYDYTLIQSEPDGNGNPEKLKYSFWGRGGMLSR